MSVATISFATPPPRSGGEIVPTHDVKVNARPVTRPHSVQRIIKRLEAALETAEGGEVEALEDELEPIDESGSRWDNNRVQFARLLAELRAVGLTDEQYAALRESMDLARDRIDEVLERAETEWQRLKEQV